MADESNLDHPVRVSFSSECDEDAQWHVTSMAIREGFNEPYAIDLDVRSFDFAGDPSSMLGARSEVVIERAGLRRVMLGILDHVETGPLVPELVTARVRVSPALVALRHRRNSRVFTDMSVIEVLREVMEPTLAGFGRELDTGWLGETYPKRAYITQYQESDLDFVDRLMEDEGIAYRFSQDGDAETLILLDNDSGYTKLNTASGPEGLLPMVTADGGSDQREDLRSFGRKVRLTANRARAASFDWRSPSDDKAIGGDGVALGVNADGPELEDYDFEAAPVGAGAEVIERKLNLKRRRLNQAAQRFVARTTATGLTVGSKFEVVDHPNGDLNGEYLVTAVKHRMTLDDSAFAGAPAFAPPPPPPECAYDNECECQPADIAFVPAKTKNRPFIPGVISAEVRSDWADDSGRVAVWFHWDRGLKSTCNIPVATLSAGNGWGTQFFPRAGQQVLVAFVNGDPDQPMIVGCIYNGSYKPPYDAASRCSGLKSPTEGDDSGSRYNELMFNDTDGAELVRIHAERDFHTEAKKAHNVDVGTDQTTHVKGIQHTTVDGDRVANYRAKQRVTVGDERRMTVNGDEHRLVQGVTFETFHKKLTRTAHADVDDRVVNGNVTYTVAKSQMTVVGDNMMSSCGGERSDETGGTHRIVAAGELDITAMRGVKILAPAGIKTIGPTTADDYIGNHTRAVAQLIENINNYVSFAVAKVGHTVLSMSTKNVAVRVTGVCVGATGVSISTKSQEVENVLGPKLTNAGIRLSAAGLTVIS